MKKRINSLFVLLVTLSLFCLLTVGVFALGEETNGVSVTMSDTVPPASDPGGDDPFFPDPVGEKVPMANGYAQENSHENQETPSNELSKEDKGETDQTVSFSLVEWAGEKLPEILCGMSFAASLAVALIFRRGLLPALSGALSGFSGKLKEGVDKIDVTGQSVCASADAALEKLTAAVVPTLARIDEITAEAKELSKQSEEAQALLLEEKKSRMHTEAVLSAQMRMFYEFFMSCNLPQYQKDRLGTLMAKLEAECGGGEPLENA